MELRSLFVLTRLIALLVCSLPALALSESDSARKNDPHVVVVVWDGMRPDFVSERNVPTLWKLTREGVTFRHHHSVYPTATNVNGAALATGVYPNRNGLLANREYRPRIDPQRAFENGDLEVIEKGDETSGGKYLALQPLPKSFAPPAGALRSLAPSRSPSSRTVTPNGQRRHQKIPSPNSPPRRCLRACARKRYDFSAPFSPGQPTPATSATPMPHAR